MSERKQCKSCSRRVPLHRFPFNQRGDRGATCRDCLRATKHCPSCERELPITDFSKDACSPSGRRSDCRKCRSAARAKQRREAKARAEAKQCELTAPHGVLFPGLGRMKTVPESLREALSA